MFADLLVLVEVGLCGALDQRVGVVQHHRLEDGDPHLAQHQAERLQPVLGLVAEVELATRLFWPLVAACCRPQRARGRDFDLVLLRRDLRRLAPRHALLVDKHSSVHVRVAVELPLVDLGGYGRLLARPARSRMSCQR